MVTSGVQVVMILFFQRFCGFEMLFNEMMGNQSTVEENLRVKMSGYSSLLGHLKVRFLSTSVPEVKPQDGTVTGSLPLCSPQWAGAKRSHCFGTKVTISRKGKVLFLSFPIKCGQFC